MRRSISFQQTNKGIESQAISQNLLRMTDIHFDEKEKSGNMPTNIVSLHSSLFSCYSQPGTKDETFPESSTPQIGVRISNFDDDNDVVTTEHGLAVIDSSKVCVNEPFQITHNFSNEMDNDRRASHLSDETIG